MDSGRPTPPGTAGRRHGRGLAALLALLGLALSQTVKTKSISGAPSSANSSQLLERRPSVGSPAYSTTKHAAVGLALGVLLASAFGLLSLAAAARAIITEASVNFLGFGDPTSVSWGMMLQDAFTSQALSRGQYAWFVPPGICIILIVVAGFFISRGYEEVFMPRLRGR